MGQKIWFSSDHHWDDDRFDIMQRFFKTIDEQIDYMKKRWNEIVKPNDLVYYLGDVFKYEFNPDLVNSLNGQKILIKGNHDKSKDEEYLNCFLEVKNSILLKIKTKNKDLYLYLNHYPEKGKKEYFNLVGHIHGLWRVQRNMLNVSVDAWHYCPIDINMVLFMKNAIDNHYDINVFAGELEANKK